MPQFPQHQTVLSSGQLGIVQPLLSSYNPPPRLNTGVTCAWSQRWWMLGGNHGNCQVSVSLPLPVTLRCHLVLVTSWTALAPPWIPGRCGRGMRWWRQGCARDPLPQLGVRSSSRLCPGCWGSLHPRCREPELGGAGKSPTVPHCHIPGAGSIPAQQRRRKEPCERHKATSASA